MNVKYKSHNDVEILRLVKECVGEVILEISTPKRGTVSSSIYLSFCVCHKMVTQLY